MVRLTLAVVAVALVACGGAGPTPAADRAAPCRVTLPSGSPPAPEDFNHGTPELAAAIWPRGKLVAGVLPDGSAWAQIRPDGSIDAKLGWWRGAEGALTIEGERLDGASPPLRASIPAGYGPRGFQATGPRSSVERLGERHHVEPPEPGGQFLGPQAQPPHVVDPARSASSAATAIMSRSASMPTARATRGPAAA